MDKTMEDAKESQKKRTMEMKSYYKAELKKWQEAKRDREEAFEFCRSRQGDNSEAIKQRNR